MSNLKKGGWNRQFGKLTIIDDFTGYDGLQYYIYEYCKHMHGSNIVYLIHKYDTNCNFTDKKYYLTKEESEEKKKNIINGIELDLKESKFEEEIISEDIAYMPTDEFNEEYYYNTITGKKIEHE